MRLTYRSVFLPALVALAAVAASATAGADDSPLKSWMKTNMGATKASGDFPGLAKAFEKMAGWVPDPAWSEWAPISRQGLAAAKAQDKDGVKESCNACHKKYKDEYKQKYASKVPPK